MASAAGKIIKMFQKLYVQLPKVVKSESLNEKGQKLTKIERLKNAVVFNGILAHLWGGGKDFYPSRGKSACYNRRALSISWKVQFFSKMGSLDDSASGKTYGFRNNF